MRGLIFVGLIFVSLSGWATIDSEADVFVPYTPSQASNEFSYLAENWGEKYTNAQMFCLTSYMYMDLYSSSSLPKYEFMVEPYNIPTFPKEYGPVQINLLADGIIKVQTDWDKFDKYVQLNPKDWNSPMVQEPEFTIDVSGYDQSTKAGRLQSIVMAKLAVISLHYNLAQYGALFRLKLEIKGLPTDQKEFKKEGFSTVFAKTQYPYSGPSPVAKAFYEELLAKDFCPDTYKKAKSF